MPFSFDAAQLAEAYPDLRKPMLSFEKVFDKLLKANEHIDNRIKVHNISIIVQKK